MKKHFHREFMNKRGTVVYLRNNNMNSALSTLKKKVNEEGIKKELREREHFVSKQEKARRKKSAAIRRQQKTLEEKRRLDSMTSI